MNVQERNLVAKKFVNQKIKSAKLQSENNFQSYTPISEIYKTVTNLIEVKSMGFRGVVLTAIVGLQLDTSFDPLTKFYDCNPRSIFEHGIWYALNENSIPCGKSDPLNVAKNTNILDEGWAQGRRPQSAAIAAITFLRKIMSSNATEREKLINYFFFRLVKFAETISSFVIAPANIASISNQQLSNKLIAFILGYPESGNMPQFLIAKLLEASASASVVIKGGTESVFGTNTTSKKPADIWTESNGEVGNLYEVTVKKVDVKRLEDCLDALRPTNNFNKPVTFICRIPEDTNSLELSNQVLVYKSKTFDFVDIRQFITSIAALLSPEELHRVTEELEQFVSGINISTGTKEGWNTLFSV